MLSEKYTREARLVASRLDDNGSGLWDITGLGGQSYGLRGAYLVEFIRLSILALLAGGGRPVVAEEDGPNWIETFRYGTEPQEIADAVIAEWQAEGSPIDVEWGRWWFAFPIRRAAGDLVDHRANYRHPDITPSIQPLCGPILTAWAVLPQMADQRAPGFGFAL